MGKDLCAKDIKRGMKVFFARCEHSAQALKSCVGSTLYVLAPPDTLYSYNGSTKLKTDCDQVVLSSSPVDPANDQPNVLGSKDLLSQWKAKVMDLEAVEEATEGVVKPVSTREPIDPAKLRCGLRVLLFKPSTGIEPGSIIGKCYYIWATPNSSYFVSSGRKQYVPGNNVLLSQYEFDLSARRTLPDPKDDPICQYFIPVSSLAEPDIEEPASVFKGLRDSEITRGMKVVICDRDGLGIQKVSTTLKSFVGRELYVLAPPGSYYSDAGTRSRVPIETVILSQTRPDMTDHCPLLTCDEDIFHKFFVYTALLRPVKPLLTDSPSVSVESLVKQTTTSGQCSRCGYPGPGSTRELFDGLCRSCRMIVVRQKADQLQLRNKEVLAFAETNIGTSSVNYKLLTCSML